MLRIVRITAIIRQDASIIAAKRALELDVGVQGATVEEALANLCEAMELHVVEEPVPSGPHDLARARIKRGV